jgi:hypothetical protein
MDDSPGPPRAPLAGIVAGARPFGALHADAVGARLSDLLREILAATARVAHRVVHGRAWVRSGCYDLEEFSFEWLGISVRTLRRRAALGRGIASFPALERAFFGEDGEPPLGELAASTVASIASPAHVRRWIEVARTVPQETLSRLARAAREAGSSAVPEWAAAGRAGAVCGRSVRPVRRPARAATDDARLDLRDALDVVGRTCALLQTAGQGNRDDAVAQIRDLTGLEREVTATLALLVARMDSAGAWRMVGYLGLTSWAEQRLGAAKTTAHELLVLGRALEGSGDLRATVLAGAVAVRDVVRAARHHGPVLPAEIVHRLVVERRQGRGSRSLRDPRSALCAPNADPCPGAHGQLPDGIGEP